MTVDEFLEIINSDVYSKEYMYVDGLFEGLKIFKKYGPLEIESAGHDIVYSVDVEKIIDAGITKEDAAMLSKMGWFVDTETIGYPGCLAYFV